MNENLKTSKHDFFRLKLRRVILADGSRAWVHGTVTHGSAEVGTPLVLVAEGSQMGVILEQIVVNGVELKEVPCGSSPELLIRHEPSADLTAVAAARELRALPKVELPHDWKAIQVARELHYRAQKHRDRELQRMRKQLLCNLEILCVRGNSRQFEELICEMFRRLGFTTKLTPPTNDGGKDVICKREKSTTYVECKFFSPNQKVGRPHLQKLAGAVATDRVDGGICVTTGLFTQQAIDFARRARIELWDVFRVSEVVAEQFPERRLPLIYSAVCEVCGQEVSFELFNPRMSDICPSGHNVTKTIFGRDALPDAPGHERFV